MSTKAMASSLRITERVRIAPMPSHHCPRCGSLDTMSAAPSNNRERELYICIRCHKMWMELVNSMLPLLWITEQYLVTRDHERRLAADSAYGGFRTFHDGMEYISCGVLQCEGTIYALMHPLICVSQCATLLDNSRWYSAAATATEGWKEDL